MLPEIKLQANLELAALSPLIRGMILALSFAEQQGGIGLTATGAINRKFVHWAAVHFAWPGYSADELYSVNKVLNEGDMPPLWVVRDMMHHFKFVRRKKDRLLATKLGRDFLATPSAHFDQIATKFLYGYIQYGEHQNDVLRRAGLWHVFLNFINFRAGHGFKAGDLLIRLYPDIFGNKAAEQTPQAWEIRSEFQYDVLRRLCWLGVLYEDREGLSLLKDGTYHKTPLWSACLHLENDSGNELGIH